LKFTHQQKIYYALRVASAMCFIGHGSFGIIKKAIWSNYFGVFGIGHDASLRLMPLIGSIDILMGIIILVYPIRAIIAWLVIWGTITALLRPLSGEPFAEFIERAGNFGAPLAMIILSGGVSAHFKKLFSPIKPGDQLDKTILQSVTACLRFVVFFLFIGHGWLNVIEKRSLVDQYRMLGFVDPARTAQLIGMFEIIAAFGVLIRPIRAFVLVLFIWKITSELFYPHYELFEWVERGGSYGCILALWFALGANSFVRKNGESTKPGRYLFNYDQQQTNHFLSNYKGCTR
jgi:hypothetical protein